MLYETEPLAIKPSPDLKVTVGVEIDSLAVKVNVISSPALARVLIELLLTMLTLLKVGATSSTSVIEIVKGFSKVRADSVGSVVLSLIEYEFFVS